MGLPYLLQWQVPIIVLYCGIKKTHNSCASQHPSFKTLLWEKDGMDLVSWLYAVKKHLPTTYWWSTFVSSKTKLLVRIYQQNTWVMLMKQPCISGIRHRTQTYNHRSLHQVQWKTTGRKGLPNCVSNAARNTQSKTACYWQMQKHKHSEGCQNFSIHLWRKHVRNDYQTSLHGPVWKPTCARGCGTLRTSRTYQWCHEMLILDNYSAHPDTETSCQR